MDHVIDAAGTSECRVEIVNSPVFYRGDCNFSLGGAAAVDIADAAESVVILIDVSASMFGRTGDYDYGTRKLLRQGKEQSFQTVRDEAIKLIEGLDLNARFNIIHWSGSE